VWSLEDVAALLDAKAKPTKRGPYKKRSALQHREQGMKVRLIKPNGEMAFTQDFKTSSAAALRYARLVEACVNRLLEHATKRKTIQKNESQDYANYSKT
jgi:hypothetical protein